MGFKMGGLISKGAYNCNERPVLKLVGAVLMETGF